MIAFYVAVALSQFDIRQFAERICFFFSQQCQLIASMIIHSSIQVFVYRILDN